MPRHDYTKNWSDGAKLCGNCVHWDRASPARGTYPPLGRSGPHTDGTLSECRRHAPRGVQAVGYSGRDDARWPHTSPTDWCGDFEARKD